MIQRANVFVPVYNKEGFLEIATGLIIERFLQDSSKQVGPSISRTIPIPWNRKNERLWLKRLRPSAGKKDKKIFSEHLDLLMGN